MPLLGTLIGGLFTVLFNIFGRFFVMEKAFHLAAALAHLVLFVALIAAMKSCYTGVCAAAVTSISVSHPGFGVGLSLAFNSITYAAAGCYMTVWMLCQLYIMKKRMSSLLLLK